MTTILVKTELPSSVIESSRQTGATIREECEMKVLELVNAEHIEPYTEFLMSSDEDADLLLLPIFGSPLAQYVPPNVQAEVHQLLATFQPLLSAALRGAAPPPPLAAFGAAPPLGGYQYHHAEIAIQRVMQEIENPDLAFALVGLNMVASGNVICDMTIVYSNCVVVRRIRKF